MQILFFLPRSIIALNKQHDIQCFYLTLGLAQRKRASPRGEAGTSGFPCVSDSDRRAHTRTNRHCHTISHAGHTNMLAVSHTHISPSLHDLSASPGAPALANLSHTRFEHSHQHAPAARSGRSQPSPASRTHTPRSSRPRHRSRSEPQPRRTRAGLWEM